jgi:hypothetical protein
MLPALRGDTPSLADVLTGSFAAMQGLPSALGLPPVRSAAVILVDGLGASALRERTGHARRLTAALPSRSATLTVPFPTTTAAALATLTTGRSAGQHGLTGYSAIDPDSDRVVRLLSGWDATMRPREWQPHDTVFEQAGRAGMEAVVVGAERYRVTGFTDAVLRGARFEAAKTIDERISTAVRLLREGGPRLVYVYIPELDMAGHADGVGSDRWLSRLDELDGALAPLETQVPDDAGVLLTADHGMLDVPPHRRRVLAADDPLWAGVRHVAGEPRCLQLGLDDPSQAEAVRDRWLEAEGARSWVVTRAEAVEAGWFGTVDDAVLPRIGDVLVAARGLVAYYDARTATPSALAMVGQHGSFSPEETQVPLARWGAFAV